MALYGRGEPDVRLDLAPPARRLALEAAAGCCCSSRPSSALLLFVVFPWLEPHLPISQVTVPGREVGSDPRSSSSTTTTASSTTSSSTSASSAPTSMVRRNDAVAPADLDELDVDGVLHLARTRARPRTPARRWRSSPRCAERALPLFGVCLGHQAIGAVFGAPVVRAPELLHGKTSEVLHDGTGVLAGLPSPFTATRYHSLAVEEAALPAEIVVTGRTESGVVMALRHRDAADRRRAVPPRVGAHPGRPPDGGQLAGPLRRHGRRRARGPVVRRGGGAPLDRVRRRLSSVVRPRPQMVAAPTGRVTAVKGGHPASSPVPVRVRQTAARRTARPGR